MLKCFKFLASSKTACNHEFLFSMCTRQAVRQLQRGVFVYFLLPPPPPASMVATRMKMFSVSEQIPMHLGNRKSKLILLNANSIIQCFTPFCFMKAFKKPNYDCPQCLIGKNPCIFVLPSLPAGTTYRSLNRQHTVLIQQPSAFMLCFYLFISKNFEEGQYYSNYQKPESRK